MKRIANPVETDALCSYGCGEVAKFINGSNRLMCCERSNSCKAVRERNSKATKESNASRDYIAQYNNLSTAKKEKIAWNKGKFSADFSYEGKGQHKTALIAERGHKCECCVLTEWNGIPITLELEHTDGDRQNNTKENLKLLCPNCHSQTPTWRRSKSQQGFKKQRYSDEEIVKAVIDSDNLNQVLTKLDLRYGSVSTIISVMGKYKVNFKGG